MIDLEQISFCNRELDLSHSSTIAAIRVGAHPDKLRFVVEFAADQLPQFFKEHCHQRLSIGFQPKQVLAQQKKQETDTATPKLSQSDQETSKKIGQTVEEVDLDFKASLWNKAALDTGTQRKREAKHQNHIDFRPELELKYGQDVRAVAGARANAFFDDGAGESNRTDLELFNAYIEGSGEEFNLRVGNQIVRWGKADEVSPLDNLNPEDLRDGFVRLRSERKLPVPMVNLEVFDQKSKVQGIFIPYHTRSKLDFFDTDWSYFSSSAEPTEYEQERLSKTLSNSQYGSRLSGTIEAFDYGVSYFSGHSNLPALQSLNYPANAPVVTSPTVTALADYARESGQTIKFNYPQREIYGFDFETVVDSIGLRGDLAYIEKESFVTNTLRSERRPVYRYVLGGDYSSPDDLYFNLQFSQSIIKDWDDSLLFSRRVTNGFYSELSQLFWHSEAQVGLRSFYDITMETYYFNPYLSLLHWSNLTAEFGVDILGGPLDTVIGNYRENDQIYLILRGYL